MLIFGNLFLSCGHCNNIKLGKYENILDCSKIDVDEFIIFRKKCNFSREEKIEINNQGFDSKEIEVSVCIIRLSTQKNK